MITIPNAPERYQLDLIMGSISPYYHLFVNDLVPDEATVLGDFTEPDWPGYAPRPVTSWTPAMTTLGVAVTFADPVVWVRGVGGTAGQVFGYFVRDGSGGPLIWTERRAAGPVPMSLPSDAVEVLPRFTLRQSPFP